MKRTPVRTRTAQDVREERTPSQPCDLLAQIITLRVRFEVYALPDDFLPGYSLRDALDKIRQLYSNYDELVEELESMCIQAFASGYACRFSKKLASGTDRRECPALTLVLSTLKRVADERAEEALINWPRPMANWKPAEIVSVVQNEFER